MSARIGSDCGMVPDTGMGSFHSMSMAPVVTAVAHNPLLTTFASDVRKAGLAAKLDSAKAITIFAPENSAFAKLHGAAMSMMEHDATLASILRYHIVTGHVTPEELAAGKALKTLQGGILKPAKMGAIYEVNSADIVCGNIATANASVYIINAVLEPGHMH
ncbi:MAG TPA: fasciclin domain-containing protein [Streptosporangiaceae bacterium]|nr:fasciclin domain-containing protein [Streptosporangiaceae bacterium]